MLKRSMVSLLLAASVLTLSLFGCSGGEQASSPDSNSTGGSPSSEKEQTGEENEEIYMTMWGGLSPESGIQSILDNYMEEHPNVKIEYTRFTNDEAGNTKLDTALLSGEQIDIYFTYSTTDVVNRATGGMAVDLAELGGDKFIEENIGTEGVFKVDGKYYSVPSCKEPTAMMLNKDAFDEAGIPIPTEWTIDEFGEIAKKLNNPEKGMYGVHPLFYEGVIPISTTILGSNATCNADGTASNFDNPAFEFDRLSYDLVFTDQCAYPYEEIIAKQVTGQWNRLFVSGNMAIAIFQPWMANTMRNLEEYPHDFQTVFAPLPVPEKGKEYYNLGTLSNFMMINSKSNCKEEAWDVIEYWLTEGAAELLPYGKIPVVKDFEDPDMAAKILQDPEEKLFDLESFTEVVLDPDAKYVCDTITIASNEIAQIEKEETDRLMLGQQSWEEYLQNLKTRCDEAIAAAS